MLDTTAGRMRILCFHLSYICCHSSSLFYPSVTRCFSLVHTNYKITKTVKVSGVDDVLNEHYSSCFSGCIPLPIVRGVRIVRVRSAPIVYAILKSCVHRVNLRCTTNREFLDSSPSLFYSTYSRTISLMQYRASHNSLSFSFSRHYFLLVKYYEPLQKLLVTSTISVLKKLK